ncbi:hypothetical protein BDW75DRAFT_219047 [Aspergillus navahoensis]
MAYHEISCYGLPRVGQRFATDMDPLRGSQTIKPVPLILGSGLVVGFANTLMVASKLEDRMTNYSKSSQCESGPSGNGVSASYVGARVMVERARTIVSSQTDAMACHLERSHWR